MGEIKEDDGILNATCNDMLMIGAKTIMEEITWHLDAAFGVHDGMRSHTGAVMTLGNGVIQAISTKQKVKSRRSTEAKLILIDNMLPKVLWKNYLWTNKDEKLFSMWYS